MLVPSDGFGNCTGEVPSGSKIEDVKVLVAGARTLLGAPPDIATSNKKLLGALGLTTRSGRY